MTSAYRSPSAPAVRPMSGEELSIAIRSAQLASVMPMPWPNPGIIPAAA